MGGSPCQQQQQQEVPTDAVPTLFRAILAAVFTPLLTRSHAILGVRGGTLIAGLSREGFFESGRSKAVFDGFSDAEPPSQGGEHGGVHGGGDGSTPAPRQVRRAKRPPQPSAVAKAERDLREKEAKEASKEQAGSIPPRTETHC